MIQALLRVLFGKRLAKPAQAIYSREEIQNWLIAKLCAQLRIPPDEVQIREPFTNYGLDSRTLVSLSGELEDLLQVNLSPTLLWDHPTIWSLSHFLAGKTAGGDPEKTTADPPPS